MKTAVRRGAGIAVIFMGWALLVATMFGGLAPNWKTMTIFGVGIVFVWMGTRLLK